MTKKTPFAVRKYTAKKVQSGCKGIQVTAYLIQLAIDQLSSDPALRKQLNIDLKELAEAAKVRRKLLKQIPK